MAVATTHMGMMIFTTAPGATSLTATTGLPASNSAGRSSANPGKNAFSRLQPGRIAIVLTGPALRAFPPQTALAKGRSFPAIDHAPRANMPVPPENTGSVLRVNMSVLEKNAGRVPLYRRNSAHVLVLKSVKRGAGNRANVPVRTGKVRETEQGSAPAAEPDSIPLILLSRLGPVNTNCLRDNFALYLAHEHIPRAIHAHSGQFSATATQCFYGFISFVRQHSLERLFRRLKGFRRIATRYDKLDIMFIAFIVFALVVEAL